MSKTLNIFGTLISKVVNQNLCSYCGTCVASCPVNVLALTDDEKPTIRGVCALCQVCYYSCPRVELPVGDIERAVFGRTRNPEEKTTGIIVGSYSARSTDQGILKVCQDGGVATSIMKYALDRKLIDCAVVTKTSGEKAWRPSPIVATEFKQLLETAGTKYTLGGTNAAVGDAVLGYPKGRIGMVGLPCQIEGLRRMQTSSLGNTKMAERVVLTVGIFCSESYYYSKLVNEYLRDKHGIDPSQVTRMGVKKNRFKVNVGEKVVLDVPVAEVDVYMREPCRKCIDYTSELADISVGGVGSPEGWNTVITRTKCGEEVFKSACGAGLFEWKPLSDVKPGMALVSKISEKKKTRDASAYIR